MSKKQDNKKNEELEQLQTRVTDLENQLKRAVADYQNLERRISEGRSEMVAYVGAELLRKLIPTLDHLEQALGGTSEQEKESGWFKGVELAVKEFKQVLAQEGLDEIPEEGQFDPSLHEAVDTREPSSAEASAGKGENSILEVVRKGYNLNGKVLRPAQVIVGRKQDNHPEEQSSDEGSGEGEMSS
ncbi:MAG: nucleotide exchange factor GrpE [Candidatus Daviesbacteria bacterium]|nr:nucleotide exchange factor GrpE [Candidatus Daviesbacteria bacterium]